MTWTRRQFALTIALAGLGGCARLKRSNLSRFAPNRSRKKDRVLRMAVINEPHLTNARSVGLLGRAVNTINNDPDIDFVVVVGNLTGSGSLQEMALLYPALQRLDAPYFCLPGEQDQQIDALDPYENYQRYFQRNRWRENWGAWTIIGLDCPSEPNGVSVMPVENLVWLEQQLARIDSSRPLALFCPRSVDPDGLGTPLENGADVLARFQYHNLLLVVNGGFHSNHHSVRDEILFVSSACCSSVIENDDDSEEKGIQLFNLDGPTIAHNFVHVPR